MYHERTHGRVNYSNHEYREIKELTYHNNLNNVRLRIMFSDFMNIINYAIKAKESGEEITEDFIFKYYLEEMNTQFNKKHGIIPLDELTKNLIIEGLKRANGNIRITSELLKIPQRTLYRNARMLGINIPDYRGVHVSDNIGESEEDNYHHELGRS